MTPTEDQKNWVSNKDLSLELKALKSDMRLLIIASVALNQFLAHVALPTAVTVTAITAAILAPAAKSAVALFTRS